MRSVLLLLALALVLAAGAPAAAQNDMADVVIRTTDVTGTAHMPEGVEMVMPGDNVTLEINLITPIAMDKGLRFAIREGGRTVGAGTVTEVLE